MPTKLSIEEIVVAIRKTNGNASQAAKLLGINEKTLRRRKREINEYIARESVQDKKNKPDIPDNSNGQEETLSLESLIRDVKETAKSAKPGSVAQVQALRLQKDLLPAGDNKKVHPWVTYIHDAAIFMRYADAGHPWPQTIYMADRQTIANQPELDAWEANAKAWDASGRQTIEGKTNVET
ncbi:MAG: helix-turn-helix domain-containing protein [Gammaproteobacteria bacterium]|nr:helix-turn-helix domain-containing protein [Gammaproteobacteria bacterium]